MRRNRSQPEPPDFFVILGSASVGRPARTSAPPESCAIVKTTSKRRLVSICNHRLFGFARFECEVTQAIEGLTLPDNWRAADESRNPFFELRLGAGRAGCEAGALTN